MFSKAKDRAVSPVIGVIFMVAVTIFVAAIVGQFAIDFSSDTTESSSLGLAEAELVDDGSGSMTVNVERLGDGVTVELRGSDVSGESYTDVGQKSVSGTSGNTYDLVAISESGDEQRLDSVTLD